MPNYLLTLCEGYDLETGKDVLKTREFWADDLTDAEALVEENWREWSEGNKWFSVSLEENRTRGGFRPGAGRKSNAEKGITPAKPKTVAKRIRVEVAEKLDKIESLLALVEDWQGRSEASSQTNVRWEKMRQFLKEVEELGL